MNQTLVVVAILTIAPTEAFLPVPSIFSDWLPNKLLISGSLKPAVSSSMSSGIWDISISMDAKVKNETAQKMKKSLMENISFCGVWRQVFHK